MKLIFDEDVMKILQGDRKNFATNKEMAEYIGISEQYLSDIFRANRGFGKKILEYLELKQITELKISRLYLVLRICTERQ